MSQAANRSLGQASNALVVVGQDGFNSGFGRRHGPASNIRRVIQFRPPLGTLASSGREWASAVTTVWHDR